MLPDWAVQETWLLSLSSDTSRYQVPLCPPSVTAAVVVVMLVTLNCELTCAKAAGANRMKASAAAARRRDRRHGQIGRLAGPGGEVGRRDRSGAAGDGRARASSAERTCIREFLPAISAFGGGRWDATVGGCVEARVVGEQPS